MNISGTDSLRYSCRCVGLLVALYFGASVVEAAESPEQPRDRSGRVDAVERALREWDAEWDHVEVRAISELDSVYIANCEWQRDWWGILVVLGFHDGEIQWLVEPDEASRPNEQSLLDVRPIRLPQLEHPVIEVFGITHMGNGNLYLYELRGRELRLLMKTRAVDRHWGDGKVFRSDRLNVAYEDVDGDGAADVILSGIVDHYDKWKSEEVLRSHAYRKVFVWRDHEEDFIEDAEHEAP